MQDYRSPDSEHGDPSTTTASPDDVIAAAVHNLSVSLGTLCALGDQSTTTASICIVDGDLTQVIRGRCEQLEAPMTSINTWMSSH